MDKATIALLTYGATIFLLCACAVFILHFTLAKAMRDRVPVYYFMLVFVALSLSFVAFVSRNFIPEWLSIALTNAMALISVYAFRSALLWRRGNYLHLYRDQIAITNVVVLMIVNTVFFHLWIDGFYYRAIILLSNLCIVMLSMRKYVGVDPLRMTQGEKQTSRGILLVAILIFSELLASPFIQDPWFYATYVLAATSLGTMLLLGVALNLVLSDIIDTHYKNSITDILTGLYNRRYFMSQFLIAINQSRRYHSPISILICDIDNFKDINDQYGHDNGDLALQIFSEMLKTSVRDVDIVARYGGEEFIILMPRTPLGEAKRTAERLRVNTEKLCVMSKKKVFGFTISIGLSSGEAEFDVKDYIKLADEALYRAKNDGRNRVFSVSA